MDIRFFGHACFELADGDASVLIDPFLKPNNPVATVTGDELDPTTILITHGHVDHLADAVPIAKRSGATIAAIVELANWFDAQGVESTVDPNLGGTVEFDWGWVRLVPAWHTSTTPNGTVSTPAGLVISLGGKIVYHLGDTCLFSDLKLVQERDPIDVALVCIGGHFTMDRRDAAIAAEWVGAKTVVPCHYDTFPPIETDAHAFKQDVESRTRGRTTVEVLDPGSTLTL
jgi:L-ascorbate metabolism protein UlaG (beta-lactamase superfamily)